MDQQQNQKQNQSVSINVASSDPMLEQRIFNQVASAGRQLARMADVMSILVEQFESTSGEFMTSTQRDSIQQFQEMCDRIKKEKVRHTADNILRQMDSLKANDATEYANLLSQLQTRFEKDSNVL